MSAHYLEHRLLAGSLSLASGCQWAATRRLKALAVDSWLSVTDNLLGGVPG
ncbi:hypothetical protein [Heliobacterium mobile]|nr:hypothetical protein [Heliobacterium mobile]